jgi:DNA-binding response OmpR family regulator
MSEDFIPRSILLVEDEPRLRKTLERSLTGRGYKVDQATTVAEACVRALSGAHDVMLLDVNLPDATGWDVLSALREAGSSLPSIVLSAAPPNPVRVRAFRPAGILYKPFPMDALLRLIRSVCGDPAFTSGVVAAPVAKAPGA